MNRGNVSIALLALFVSVFVHREDVSAESPRLGGGEITSAGEAEATPEVEKSVAEVESPESPANELPEYYRNAKEMEELGTALKETRTGRNSKISRVYNAVRWPGDAATFPVIQMREERASDNSRSTLVLLARTTAGEQELDRSTGDRFTRSSDEVVRPLASGGVHITWRFNGYRHLLLRLDENGDVVVAQKWNGRSHASTAPDWTLEPGPEAMMLNLRKEVPAPNYFLAATEIPANGASLPNKHLRWQHDGSEFPVLFRKPHVGHSEVVLLVRTASGTKRLARYAPGSYGKPSDTYVRATTSGALILRTALIKGGKITEFLWAKAVIRADGRPVVAERWRGSGSSPKRPAWTKPQASDEAIAEAVARLREAQQAGDLEAMEVAYMKLRFLYPPATVLESVRTGLIESARAKLEEAQQADDLEAMEVAYRKLLGLNPPATVLASLSPELIERATTVAEVAYRAQSYYALSEAASALGTFGAPPSVMAALAVQIDELDHLRRFSEEGRPGPLRLGMTKSEAKRACQGEGKFTNHESGFVVCSRTDRLEAYALGYCGTVACLESAYWIPEGELMLELPADRAWADIFSGYFGKGTSRKKTAERVTTWKIDSNKSAAVKVIKVGGFKLAAVTVEDLSLGDNDDRGEDRRVELARMHMSFATAEKARRDRRAAEEKAQHDRRARILRERPYCKRYKNVEDCPKFHRDDRGDCRYDNGALNVISPKNAIRTRSLAGEPAWCSRPCLKSDPYNAARAQMYCCAPLREAPSPKCPTFR